MTEQRINIPNEDHDVILVGPDGQEITIQFRPSNADFDHSGSLDFILPKDQVVTCWIGDDMDAAPAFNGHQHIRRIKQMATDLPWNAE